MFGFNLQRCPPVCDVLPWLQAVKRGLSTLKVVPLDQGLTVGDVPPSICHMEGSHLQRWSHCEDKQDNSSTLRCRGGDHGQDYRDTDTGTRSMGW